MKVDLQTLLSIVGFAAAAVVVVGAKALQWLTRLRRVERRVAELLCENEELKSSRPPYQWSPSEEPEPDPVFPPRRDPTPRRRRRTR